MNPNEAIIPQKEPRTTNHARNPPSGYVLLLILRSNCGRDRTVRISLVVVVASSCVMVWYTVDTSEMDSTSWWWYALTGSSIGPGVLPLKNEVIRVEKLREVFEKVNWNDKLLAQTLQYAIVCYDQFMVESGPEARLLFILFMKSLVRQILWFYYSIFSWFSGLMTWITRS
jgi:hypothetical protein